MRISLIQMDCRLGDAEFNFGRAAGFVREAARQGSDLVLLPELWSTAYDLARAPELAAFLAHRDSDGGWFGRLGALAHTHSVWLAGSMLEARDGRYYNCLALYSPQGELAGVYRKVHLFRLMQEEQFLAPGEELASVDLPWGRAGLAICYDLRFPEMFRRYVLDGARIVLLPAEWPNPRREHWRTLLRARAIENQCFVAACNRVGETSGTTFFGASAVIDAWGETVIEGGDEEAVLTADVDLGLVDEVRKRIPVLADRRRDLYG